MAEFLQMPSTTWVGGAYPWRLESPCVYASDLKEIHDVFPDGVIGVPKGFHTDYASVPRIPLVYVVAGGRASMPAVLHDWLYDCCTGLITRKTADQVFLEAMEVIGYPWPRRRLLYAGVRLGGWRGWQRDSREKCPRGAGHTPWAT